MSYRDERLYSLNKAVEQLYEAEQTLKDMKSIYLSDEEYGLICELMFAMDETWVRIRGLEHF